MAEATGGIAAWTRIPRWAREQPNVIEAYVVRAVAAFDERSGDLPCVACNAMLRLVRGRGPGAEFPLPTLGRPRGLVGLAQPNAEYDAFRQDDDVRMRYLVQAHLYWFGYYPELMSGRRAAAPGRTTIKHRSQTGFPGAPVDGVWGNNSKHAYRAFLADQPAEDGRTGWEPEGDVLGIADARLIRVRCGELYERPGFDYYRQYKVSKGAAPAHRPFLYRREQLEGWEGPDPILAEVVERERELTPADALTCHAKSVSAASAVCVELPGDICWPVRPSRRAVPAKASAGARIEDDELPAELRRRGITSAQARSLGIAPYRYNPERWTISYRHARGWAGGAGRSFNAGRGSDRMHAGIDLYADYGDPVVAVTAGTILGLHHAAPLSTSFLFVYHPALDTTLNYGEVHHESLMRFGLMVGDDVRAGQVIGAVGRMNSTLRHGGTMLHVDAYTGRQDRWFGVGLRGNGFSLGNRVNPTALLLAIREREHARRSG